MQVSLPKEFGKGVKDVHNEPFMKLGETYKQHVTDNLYRYVRFAEDVTEGMPIRMKYVVHERTNLAPQVSGGSVYAPVGSRKITEHDAGYLSSLEGLPSGEVPFFAHGMIVVVSGAGDGQSGMIQSYSNQTMNIDWYEKGQALKTALNGTSDYIVYAPWLVEQADALVGSERYGAVNGVVVAESAKALDYGFVIENGRERVRIASGTVLKGVALKPGDTAAEEGEGEPITSSDVFDAFATTEHDGSQHHLVWCSIYCKPISQIMVPPEALESAFPPAEAIS